MSGQKSKLILNEIYKNGPGVFNDIYMKRFDTNPFILRAYPAEYLSAYVTQIWHLNVPLINFLVPPAGTEEKIPIRIITQNATSGSSISHKYMAWQIKYRIEQISKLN